MVRRLAHWAKVLFINAVVLMFFLALAEALLALIWPVPELWNTVSGWKWKDSPYRAYLIQSGIRGQQFWGSGETNELGFRGRKIQYADSDYVVLLVGDSHVEAAASRFEDIPEIILERSLKSVSSKSIKVFSIGASGWSQDQQLLALQEYFKDFRADLVVLWHTPTNDFWENAFPDRSTTPAAAGASHLKPVFLLKKDGDTIELFDPPTTLATTLVRLLRRCNVGRGVLHILARLPILQLEEFEPNNEVLKKWLQMIPPTVGHEEVGESHCPSQIIEQWMFTPYYDDFTNRLVTIETFESVEESRSHLTPFVAPPSLRDQYTKEVTHALLRQMKKLATQNGAEFMVFAPEFQFKGVSFGSEIRCAKRGTQFFRVDSNLLGPISQWKDEIDFEKLSIEVGNYGMAAITVDRRDPDHLNFLGNKLVTEALAQRLALRRTLPTF